MEIHLLRTGGAVFVRDGKEIARYDEPRLMADAVAVLLDELEELVELRTKLRNRDATIAKLDKTADGVPVVPGLDYWFYSSGLKRFIHSVVSATDAYAACHSTREACVDAKAAAEAAREQERK